MQAPTTQFKTPRFEALDGLRGIAIFLVVSFHVFNLHPTLLPFPESVNQFVLFETGWLGANLFFLISGFIIVMTIEKASNFKSFILKRWIRLFPAMLVATIILLLSYFILTEGRYFPDYQILDIIPGFTLIEPYFWNALFYFSKIDIHISGINPSFWALYADMKFYLFFASLYFLLGAKKTTYISMLWYLISLPLYKFGVSNTLIRVFLYLTSGIHFGWFVVGSMVYLYIKEKSRSTLLMMILFAVMTVIGMGQLREGIGVSEYVVASTMVIVFVLAVINSSRLAWLSWKPLLWLGSISYSLFLIHEPILIPSIHMIVKRFGIGALWPASIVMIVFVLIVSLWMTRVAEPAINSKIKQWVSAH